METLHGREAEEARLSDLLAACTRGIGGIAVVRGVTGMGKSALLRRLTRQAADADFLVLAAGDVRTEGARPLGVIAELLAGTALPPSAAERVAELFDDPTLSAARGNPASNITASTAEADEAAANRVSRAVWGVLRDLAADNAVLVIVDDVHHADAASLRCLLRIARGAHTARILLVLADSEHETDADPLFRGESFRTELLRQPRSHRIRLGRLTPGAVAAMAGVRPESPAAAELAALSGGSPLLVRALLADRQESGHRPGGRTVPGIVVGDAFRQAVLSCAHRVAPAMLFVGRGVALLGTAATPAALSRILALDAAAVRRALLGLEDVGLLDAGRFRHPAMAAAVLHGLPNDERHALHRRVVDFLQDAGAGAQDVARHLIAARRTHGRWVLPLLRDAAEQADLSDDTDFAVQCLHLAAAACATQAERAAVLMQQVQVQWRANPAAAVRHLAPLTDALLAGSLPIGHAPALLRSLLWHGDVAAVADVLAHVENTAGHCDAEAVARLRVAQQWLRYSFPFLSDAAAAAAASPLSAHLVQAASALGASLTRGAGEDTVAVAEQVLRGGHLDDDNLDAIESALLALVYADHPDRAAQWCDPLLEHAAGRGAATWQARLAAVQGEISLRRGDLPAAERWARAALSHIPSRGWGVAVGGPLATLVLATTEMGRLEQAAQQLRRTVPPAMGQTRYGLLYRYARAHYYLAADRLHDALVDFLGCGEQLGQWGLNMSRVVLWRVGAAAVHLRMGALDHARRLLEEELRCLGAREVAALLDACDDLQAGECRPDTLTRMVLGFCARPAARLSAADPDREGAVALSDAELRVAQLAAQGATNREIAQSLFITVSTVEQHLTRVYRKLDLAGRTDLPVHLQLLAAGSS